MGSLVQRLILSSSLALFAAFDASAQTDDLSSLALSLVNEARAENDLAPLESTSTLAEAAEAHADDMLTRAYYSHESPDGDTVQDRVIDAGGSRWQLVAENIARCRGCEAADADRVRAFQEGWMQSPGHRENILREGLALVRLRHGRGYGCNLRRAGLRRTRKRSWLGHRGGLGTGEPGRGARRGAGGVEPR